MTLKAKINADFIEAFKLKEAGRDKKNFLGILKGEIQTEEGRGNEATDVLVMRILKKMEKSLKETNTPEALIELSYLEPYLPKLIGEEEVSTIIKNLVLNGANNIGAIMKAFNESYNGQADNALVSKLAKEALS